ncbi:MAG: TlpA disulfide reductase family protein [Bacteroidota bacterium]|nr:TlpA disulfide reductase family protein [Bacteroidota bacterium]
MKTVVSLSFRRPILGKYPTLTTYFILAFIILLSLPVSAKCVPQANSSENIPDTLVIEMTKMKGFGPFPKDFGILQTMDPSSPWIKSVPNIKGIPDNLRGLMFGTFEADFMQYIYQIYYAGKISEWLFNSCKNSWRWEPDSSEFTKNEIKGSIAFAAGYDENNRLKVLVDRNNNYDLSDDEYYFIPDIKEGQHFFDRYSDSLLFEAAYEYYDGHDIRKNKTWIYVDYSPEMLMPNRKSSSIALTVNHAEYYQGEFVLENKRYSIALISGGRPVVREYYKILIAEKGKDFTKGEFSDELGTEKGGLLRIGDNYYRLAKASIDGSHVTLIRDNFLSSTEGNQKGLKAFNFTAKTIDGQEVKFSDMRGKYVLIDFWGTWCSPCREEIKTLKTIYKTYKNKNLVMIGIANDNINNLKTFVDKQEIGWPQIAQDKDKNILRLYNVMSYPTIYLIDPEGRIIAKNLQDPDLLQKLKEIFPD